MESELNLLKQENARLMARVKELEQTAKEKEALEARIAELEHAVEENTQLKDKVSKLEYDFEEIKKRTQTITNTQEGKIQIPDKETLSHRETNDSVTSEQIENTSDNASSTPVEWVEPRVSDLTKSTEDKAVDDFLDRVEKESVSIMMKEGNLEKKLQDQEAIQKNSSSSEVQSVISTKINPTTEIKIPYNQKMEQGLIRELSVFINEKSPSNSISDKQISKNMLDEGDLDAKASSLRGTLGSASHLAYLFDKAKKTGQKEILRWYYYYEESEKKVRDISSKNEINNDQMARTQIYNEMEPYLPGIKREYLRMKTHKARNVYTLFKEIGIDKIKQITYSADAISSLTGTQIQNIIKLYTFASNSSDSSKEIGSKNLSTSSRQPIPRTNPNKMECLYQYAIEHGMDPEKFLVVTEAEKNRWAMGCFREDLERDIRFYRGGIERQEDTRKYHKFLTDRDRLIGEELLRHSILKSGLSTTWLDDLMKEWEEIHTQFAQIFSQT